MNSTNESELQNLGLSSDEAARRLLESGPNVVVPKSAPVRLDELRRVLFDPMGIMLLVLAGIYFSVGAVRDGIAMLVAWIPITLVGVLLSVRADRALRALRGEVKSQVRVFRDGKLKTLHATDLVPGDVLAVESGQTLPADGQLLRSRHLQVNEAALTGESLPLEKLQKDLVYCGTEVISGSGYVQVQVTGRQTRFGKIASLVSESNEGQTPLQRDLGHLVKRLFWIAILLACVLGVAEWFRHRDAASALISSLTFAMSGVPEEFPIVFTLYLSLGALRLARHGVLVKSLPSVEALGRVEVVCTDKTGTLTEGRFRLVSIQAWKDESDPILLSRYARLACDEHPIDLMDLAIHEATPVPDPPVTVVSEEPFDPVRKVVSRVWSLPDGTMVRAMKGAVEGVIRCCALSEQEQKAILIELDRLAGSGKRVLGLAAKTGDDQEPLEFLGFLVFEDPVRESAKEALRRCRDAGIRLKILTGDHAGTTLSVMQSLGITTDRARVHTGDALRKMDLVARKKAFLDGEVFARMDPEQKFELIRILKEAGIVVAMTGDGINDAPALKLADIGISMGEHATDVARSSARMILMKNDFAGLIEAVLEGRRIFANLGTSFSFLIAFHIPIFLLSLIPVLLDAGRIFLPIHILLLEVLVHPVSSLTFENRPVLEIGIPTRGFFSNTASAVVQGAVLSGICLVLYFVFMGSGEGVARSMVFLGIMGGNLTLILTSTWPGWNTKAWVTSLAIIVFGLVLLGVEPVSRACHFESLSWLRILTGYGLGIWIAMSAVGFKKFRRIQNRPGFVVGNTKGTNL